MHSSFLTFAIFTTRIMEVIYMIKNIKFRLYHALAQYHMQRGKTLNEIARSYVHDAMRHAEKANNYANKLIGMTPEIQNEL